MKKITFYKVWLIDFSIFGYIKRNKNNYQLIEEEKIIAIISFHHDYYPKFSH